MLAAEGLHDNVGSTFMTNALGPHQSFDDQAFSAWTMQSTEYRDC
jgi:hypothetical protein